MACASQSGSAQAKPSRTPLFPLLWGPTTQMAFASRPDEAAQDLLYGLLYFGQQRLSRQQAPPPLFECAPVGSGRIDHEEFGPVDPSKVVRPPGSNYLRSRALSGGGNNAESLNGHTKDSKEKVRTERREECIRGNPCSVPLC